jgi:hypothetical protein
MSRKPKSMPFFKVTCFAGTATDVRKRVEDTLAKVPGFEMVGEPWLTHEDKLRWAVTVRNLGGDVNDCWVMLTSYGMSPSEDLGSVWESAIG